MGEHTEKKIIHQISIVMFDNGEVSVNGPLHDKVLCWGLLKAAENIVTNFLGEKKIVVPNLIPPRMN